MSITLAIVGCSESDYDGNRFQAMVNRCRDQISDWKLDHSEITLVSGGCSVADHIAVDLFLKGHFAKLILYLPCEFTEESKFIDTGHSHWSKNPGRVLNSKHRKFSQKIGRDTLG